MDEWNSVLEQKRDLAELNDDGDSRFAGWDCGRGDCFFGRVDGAGDVPYVAEVQVLPGDPVTPTPDPGTPAPDASGAPTPDPSDALAPVPDAN